MSTAKEYEFYHGVIFARLINASKQALTFKSCGSTASYAIEANGKRAGLYVKHSSDRLTPWRYTFLKDHQGALDQLKQEFGEVFLVLVCGETGGVVVINYQELKMLLDHNHEPAEWISVSRGKRQMYTVKGKDGALGYKIPQNNFPNKILDYFVSQDSAEVLSMSEFKNNFRFHSLAKSVRGIFRQRKVAASNR